MHLKSARVVALVGGGLAVTLLSGWAGSALVRHWVKRTYRDEAICAERNWVLWYKGMGVRDPGEGGDMMDCAASSAYSREERALVSARQRLAAGDMMESVNAQFCKELELVSCGESTLLELHTMLGWSVSGKTK